MTSGSYSNEKHRKTVSCTRSTNSVSRLKRVLKTTEPDSSSHVVQHFLLHYKDKVECLCSNVGLSQPPNL